MRLEDYPSLYRAADQSALMARRLNARRQISYLLLLLLAATAGSFGSIPAPPGPVILFLLSTLLLVVGLALLWIDLVQNHERSWYLCRSVAESVKSLTWRYTMRAEPIGDQQTVQEADQRFLNYLNLVRNQHHADAVMASPCLADSSEITEAMHELRMQSWQQRLKHYISERLVEQREWYTERALRNRRWALRLSAIVSLLHVLALVSAVLHLSGHLGAGAAVPVFVAAAASALAWSHYSRFGEAKDSYSRAANDLAATLAAAQHVSCEEDLSRFVQNTEAALSREHTLWCVRRNTPPADNSTA